MVLITSLNKFAGNLMSINPNMTSVIDACPNVFFENICPYLESQNLGNLLLTYTGLNKKFREFFDEDQKGLDALKKRVFTNSLKRIEEGESGLEKKWFTSQLF